MRWGWFAAGAVTGGLVTAGALGVSMHRRQKALVAKLGNMKTEHDYQGIAITVEPMGLEYVAQATFDGKLHTEKGPERMWTLQRMVNRIDKARETDGD